ncbi:MAG: hypothetical protein HKN84_02755 [Gammaproteobacteria bacterium]|nr:hypothetical protein [Gammaproteobacteria bacterium]
MPETLRKRDRLIFGVLLPIVVMVVGLLIIMNLPTGAGAAEFAALGIMLGAITVAPIVLLVNLVVAFQDIETPLSCFKRGMVVPGLVLIGALVYQIGLWDAIT